MLDKIVRACGNFFEEGAETTLKVGVYFGLGCLFKAAHFIHNYEGIDLRRDLIKVNSQPNEYI